MHFDLRTELELSRAGMKSCSLGLALSLFSNPKVTVFLTLTFHPFEIEITEAELARIILPYFFSLFFLSYLLSRMACADGFEWMNGRTKRKGEMGKFFTLVFFFLY